MGKFTHSELAFVLGIGQNSGDGKKFGEKSEPRSRWGSGKCRPFTGPPSPLQFRIVGHLTPLQIVVVGHLTNVWVELVVIGKYFVQFSIGNFIYPTNDRGY